MLAYLSQGWFSPHAPQRLAAEVIDGALDSAGLLNRAEVPPSALRALAARLARALPDTTHVGVTPPGKIMGQVSCATLRARVQDETDRNPLFQGFMMDCMDAVQDDASLEALCIHLRHISDMMQLLRAAAAPADSGPESLPLPHAADHQQDVTYRS